MKLLHQKMEKSGNSSYLSSVEEGVQMVLNSGTRVVFAGRETLYFNMKKYGIKNFQLSEKLYTRYSALTLQKGCLFLDSLNLKWALFVSLKKSLKIQSNQTCKISNGANSFPKA